MDFSLKLSGRPDAKRRLRRRFLTSPTSGGPFSGGSGAFGAASSRPPPPVVGRLRRRSTRLAPRACFCPFRAHFRDSRFGGVFRPQTALLVFRGTLPARYGSDAKNPKTHQKCDFSPKKSVHRSGLEKPRFWSETHFGRFFGPFSGVGGDFIHLYSPPKKIVDM